MKWLLGFVLALFAGALQAVEVGGVELPDQMTLDDGQMLTLNGAGVRKKFFIRIYAAGLYLPERRQAASAILAADEPRLLRMHFLYEEVEKAKLTAAWEEGFRNNLSASAYRGLEDRLARFNALFGDAVAGDVIDLAYLPGQGTSVTINGETAGMIEGADFSRALLGVWLGEKPADAGLKRGLLGGD
ncbi:MAG: chalcone isomerase family protein [Gammaproteobacteria bacterium]|nr:chalcone isomerase family protein [Gammaproteobacteria bacterium]MDX5375511.1 chalcone isomerase family protein [Gammaproteobacteria bacterium]